MGCSATVTIVGSQMNDLERFTARLDELGLSSAVLSTPTGGTVGDLTYTVFANDQFELQARVGMLSVMASELKVGAVVDDFKAMVERQQQSNTLGWSCDPK
jgi:hypothetical protein